jgi:hypothetical protein
MTAVVARIARWIYDWITVLTAALLGAPEILLHVLSAFEGIDLAPLVGPERSLQIITTVAIGKAVLALIEARRS